MFSARNALFVAAIVVSSSALQAKSLAGLHLPKSVANSLQASERQRRDNRACANFSGVWVGQCTSNGSSDVDDERLEIDQDECDTIYFDGVEVPFEGVYNQGLSSLASGTGRQFTATTHWNDNRTVMDIVFSGNNYSRGAYRSVMTARTKYWIEDGKLISTTSGTATAVEGNVTYPFGSSCTYDRQP